MRRFMVRRDDRTPSVAAVVVLLLAATGLAADGMAAPGSASQEELPAHIDYLTLAQGALPVSWSTTGPRDLDSSASLSVIDGNPGNFTIVSRAAADTVVEFVFELPALTTFDRLAVPSVLETPSPSQTFSRRVEVHGSAAGAEGPYELLAAAELATHAAPGMETDLEIMASPAVRWVRLVLVGGIEVLRDSMFYEFSEIIGNGTQEAVPLADNFGGIWSGRGFVLELHQEGPVVSGCYENGGILNGTVSGNVLRARGVDPLSGVPSLFVLLIDLDGSVRGVRSTNGAPFRTYGGPLAADGTTTDCSEIPEPSIGCGSVIHGINFDFDSDVLRPESAGVLAALFEGLARDPEAAIIIEGHTSSEGGDAYNLALSQRRAQAVVDDLVRRGIESGRLRASGVGEVRPIASNDDETGRALNRRVEVRCGEAGD